MIVEKAKKFCKDFGIAESKWYYDGRLRNFKYRHKIRNLDVIGEKHFQQTKTLQKNT